MRAVYRDINCKGRSDKITVIPIGDTHLGAKDIDLRKLEGLVEYIKRTPQVWWLGMGDFVDSINYSDKRFDVRSTEDIEELDDISYKSHQYLLKNIYLDDAHEDLMALMDADKQQGRTQRHLDTVLFQLPPNMRSVFELATEQLFSTEDIARIKGVSIERIEKTLDRARELLRDSLKDRLYES